ncbi:MAG: PTPA-CTERM sorting domain-containing protein [Limnothrix sp. RL_2_0]|nr:PTPA-CTERM sorting domain-containing protein [Limnothrix sp. RL_2_0]
MNFFANKLIPAALFATTASVAIALPSQALEISPGSAFGFAGGLVDISVTDKDNYTITFAETASIYNCSNDFTAECDGDATADVLLGFDPRTISVVNGALDPTTADPFFSGITTTNSDPVSFVLTSIETMFAINSPFSQMVSMVLTGKFYDGSGSVVGIGSLTAQDIIMTAETFSGSLAVTAVPTPAAVLPMLMGIFGAASKRKKEESA